MEKTPHGINNFICVMGLSNYKEIEKYSFKVKADSFIPSRVVIKPFIHCPRNAKLKENEPCSFSIFFNFVRHQLSLKC